MRTPGLRRGGSAPRASSPSYSLQVKPPPKGRHQKPKRLKRAAKKGATKR